jgi:hypothetical protein
MNDAGSSGVGAVTERLPASSIVFWSLMDRWGIPDETALALIDRPGGLTRSGKRPRFRLSTRRTVSSPIELIRARSA